MRCPLWRTTWLPASAAAAAAETAAAAEATAAKASAAEMIAMDPPPYREASP